MQITGDKSKYSLGAVLTNADMQGELEECQAYLLKNGICTQQDMLQAIAEIRQMTREQQWDINEEAMTIYDNRDYFWRK